jgi:hypothetical protein
MFAYAGPNPVKAENLFSVNADTYYKYISAAPIILGIAFKGLHSRHAAELAMSGLRVRYTIEKGKQIREPNSELYDILAKTIALKQIVTGAAINQRQTAIGSDSPMSEDDILAEMIIDSSIVIGTHQATVLIPIRNILHTDLKKAILNFLIRISREQDWQVSFKTFIKTPRLMYRIRRDLFPPEPQKVTVEKGNFPWSQRNGNIKPYKPRGRGRPNYKKPSGNQGRGNRAPY